MAAARPARAAEYAADGTRDLSPPASAMNTWSTLRCDAGNGLQQLQLMRPRLARRFGHTVQLLQRVFDQVQAVQDRAGQPGVVLIEVADQRLGQLRNLRPRLSLAKSASTNGSSSPSINAPSIAHADTVFRLDSTADSLIEASSSISFRRIISQVRSAISRSRHLVNSRSRRIGRSGANEGRNPCSNSR
jgi:hypothetical protein